MQHEALICDDFRKATLFITDNPWKLPLLVGWVARLVGAFVLSEAAFCRKRAGPYLKFHSALKTPRLVWVSAGFKRDHADVWNLLSFFLQQRHTQQKWRFLESAQEYAAAKTLAIGKKRSATVIALKADDEDLNDKDVPHVFNQSSFLSFVEKLDYAWTGQGMADVASHCVHQDQGNDN